MPEPSSLANSAATTPKLAPILVQIQSSVYRRAASVSFAEGLRGGSSHFSSFSLFISFFFFHFTHTNPSLLPLFHLCVFLQLSSQQLRKPVAPARCLRVYFFFRKLWCIKATKCSQSCRKASFSKHKHLGFLFSG